MADHDRGTEVLAGTAAVISTVNLIATLRKKAAAAPPVVIDELIKEALAEILDQQMVSNEKLEAISPKLDDINTNLGKILEALGAAPAVLPKRILEPFLEENQTLNAKEPFIIYESKPGRGALIWAVCDVSDPNCKVRFVFDNLTWDFKLSTLYNEGIDQPLFPGVWLSKYDAVNGHYTLIFSAGNLEGFIYNTRLIISVTYEATTGSATLKEARGIKWTYI